MTTALEKHYGPGAAAAAIRLHLRVVARGMTPPRGVTKSYLLAEAGKITGKKYKRGEYDQAAKDLTEFLDQRNAK